MAMHLQVSSDLPTSHMICGWTTFSQWYIKVSLHNNYLIIIKQNRHYCVNIC
jgi:hypothetical protein